MEKNGGLKKRRGDCSARLAVKIAFLLYGSIFQETFVGWGHHHQRTIGFAAPDCGALVVVTELVGLADWVGFDGAPYTRRMTDSDTTRTNTVPKISGTSFRMG